MYYPRVVIMKNQMIDFPTNIVKVVEHFRVIVINFEEN